MADTPGAAQPPAGYRVLRTLGHGADGWVALAVQESLQRPVAVKTLYAAEPDAVARFRREGQALSRVVSSRIVRVYDLVEDSGRWSLVMEYVAGGSLADRLQRPPALSVAERLTVLADVAEALGCAHRAGVVHRDVKPANVLLDDGGRAKLSDFGIARLTGSANAFRTQDGSVAATRRYAPPEQLADPGSESPGIDAYAFGVLAHELLVGDGTPAGSLPPEVVDAFAAAGRTDPARRPAPEALVRMLTAAPLQCWTAPQEPAPINEGTARGGPRPDRPTALRPAAPTVSPTATNDWVTPAVFRPRRRWRPATALVAGSLLGLAVAAGLALLWW